MKNSLIALAAGFVWSVALSTNAHAQTQKDVMLLTSKEALAPITPFVPATNVNNRALRDFKKTFPNVQGEDWSQIKEGWLVSFTRDEKQTKVVYGAHGNWEFTIDYYGEAKLPADVRNEVKSTYFDYTISGVDEVHIQDKDVYIVHMQDAKTWKVVRVEDGEMDLIEDFNKG
jgi:hypothetical protein